MKRKIKKGIASLLKRNMVCAFVSLWVFGLVGLTDEAAGSPIEDETVSARPMAYHRLGIIAAGFGLDNYAGELLTYQYIGRNQWGIKVALLNAHWHHDKSKEEAYRSAQRAGNPTPSKPSSTTYYAPLWVHRYFGSAEGKTVWPFLGVGISFYDSSRHEPKGKSGITPAGEFGIDFGGKTARGFASIRILPGGFDTVTTINVGFTFNWRVK